MPSDEEHPLQKNQIALPSRLRQVTRGVDMECSNSHQRYMFPFVALRIWDQLGTIGLQNSQQTLQIIRAHLMTQSIARTCRTA